MQNSAIVQQKLAEREQLLSTLDQAHMQEALGRHEDRREGRREVSEG